MAITKADDKINKSVQEMENLSFDVDFGMLAREMLGYHSGSGALKRVATDGDGHLQVDVLSGGGGDATAANQTTLIAKFPYENYQYMGSQTSGNYVYYGFKESGGTGWYIMRKDTTDDSAWAYAYSSGGGNSWTTAWATPGSESFGDPPDS